MTSRTDNMQGHLLSQFQGKKVLSAILEALGEEMAELDSAFRDLKEKRWIDTGEGAQLDGIGEIVGQPRQIEQAIPLVFFGFTHQAETVGFGKGRMRHHKESWLASSNLQDTEYRLLLWHKIFKNTSDGTTESTIQSIRYIYQLSGKEKVVLEEVGNATIAIGIGRVLIPSEQIFARALDLLVRPGGVQVKEWTHFDSNGYFGFLKQPGAKSFGQGRLAHNF